MNWKKALLLAIAAALLAGVGWFALIFGDTCETTAISRSPDGKHQLEVLAAAPFIFGAHPIKIRLKREEDWFFHTIFTTDLANDGKRLWDNAITISWPGARSVLICLRGEEQKPTGYRIDFNDGLQTKAALPCSPAKTD